MTDETKARVVLMAIWLPVSLAAGYGIHTLIRSLADAGQPRWVTEGVATLFFVGMVFVAIASRAFAEKIVSWAWSDRER